MKVNMSLREELDTRLTSWFQYKSAKKATNCCSAKW